MRAVAIDTETHLIKAGEFAPKCVSVAFYGNKNSALCLADEGARNFEALLDLGYTTVWANPGFDLATLCSLRPSLFPKVVQALEEDRVWCVQVGQKLIDIEVGCRKFYRYALGALTKRYFDVELDKGEDTWRMRYHELDGVPIDQWPPEAKDYANKDAEYTWLVFNEQLDRVDPVQMGDRVRFDVALYWMGREGMGVDEDAVLQLQKRTLHNIAKLEPEMIKEGLLKDRNPNYGLINLFTGEVSDHDWGKDIKAITDRVYRSSSVSVTDKGNIRIDGAALLETADPVLLRYAEYAKQCSIRNKDLVFLRQGVKAGRVHTRFDSLLDSGRTSSSNPNLQNLTRQPGVRECFVPQEGRVYLVADYGSAELHTLAQTCFTLFGESRLADVLNEGLDPHVLMAQRLAGVSTYEQMLEHPNKRHFRQIAKVPNFALPGGMGAEGLTKYAQGIGIDLQEVGFPAEVLIEAWKQQWPEMRRYFGWVRKQSPLITLPCGSGRVRYTESFTEAANYCFQGLAADGAGLAAWELFKACYANPTSALFGARPVMFIHDEFIVEAPQDKATEALEELCRIMVDNFNKVVPDVPVRVEGEVKSKWTK